ncbi:MAG TPA: histidine kinase dimerization/phospho-acceptor domain-containing protein [Terriglobales bacterium]|nr:histidine kinase dimerization/phospho-acceptor domain-containing protein [Terriglobales bacterium]
MYSIEEICDAMIATGSAAAFCRTEQEFLRCALQGAGELLEVGCCIFYAAPGSLFDHVGTVRVNQGAGKEFEIPETLPTAFADHVRRQSGRIVVSRDWDALSTLFPAFDFSACASLWISVGNEDRIFGTLAFFDHGSRRFERTQQKIADLAASVIKLGLESQAGRNSLHSSEAATYQHVSKLVGGVARDLINPLTAIFGYVELLKAESTAPRAAHLVTRVEEQIDKARKVIAALSTVSGQPKFSIGATTTVPTTDLERPTISLVKKPEVLESAPIWRPQSTAGSRILLVQRSEAVLEFQRSVLSALGAEIIPALSASEALDQLRTKRIDVVILDDELDESFSSKRLVSWIRENRPELADRMLLTVSRKPSLETREILETAMLPHVTKPLEVLELYSRAQQVLQAGKNPPLLQ